MDQQNKKKLWNIVKIILIAGIVVFLILATIKIFPAIAALQKPAAREQFEAMIHSLGIGGWFVMLGIQVLQVVLAVIPGEPVEIIAGVLYGGWGGLILCLLGIFVGTAIIYFTVKKLGYPFVHRIISQEKLKKFKFLNDAKRLEMLTFLLFFIPGTPKDMLTYIVPLTDIHPLRFFLLATFARIPSIITSTFAGENLGSGNWWISVLLFVIAGILGVGGILFNNYFMNKMNQKKSAQDSHD